MHDFAVDHDGRGGTDTQPFDLVMVFDLDDFNVDVQGAGSPFDYSDGGAALAAARAENFYFHFSPLLPVEHVSTPTIE